MSRRDEVDAKLLHTALSDWPSADEAAEYRHLSLALADEVDAERAVITKLLAMLEPGVSPPKSHTSCDCVECRCHKINEERHARACEIAGRKE